jgi:hypothetical protein
MDGTPSCAGASAAQRSAAQRSVAWPGKPARWRLSPSPARGGRPGWGRVGAVALDLRDRRLSRAAAVAIVRRIAAGMPRLRSPPHPSPPPQAEEGAGKSARAFPESGCGGQSWKWKLKAEAGSRKQEAGSRKQEAGSRKQEAGSRKQEAGSRKQLSSVERRACLAALVPCAGKGDRDGGEPERLRVGRIPSAVCQSSEASTSAIWSGCAGLVRW